MNNATRVIALVLLASGVLTAAQASEEDAARNRIGVPKLQGRADMRAEEVESPTLPRVQDSLKEAQALMAKIHRTGNPTERQQLMQQHLKSMNAGLAQLRTLITGNLTPRQMNQRVDLMQAMLDQMSERQRLEEEAPK
jgi:hypothetical protein